MRRVLVGLVTLQLASCATSSPPPVESKAPSVPVAKNDTPAKSKSESEKDAPLPIRYLDISMEYKFVDAGRFRFTYKRRYEVLTKEGVDSSSGIRMSWAPWFQSKPELRARITQPSGKVDTLDPTTVLEATPGGSGDEHSDSKVLQAPLPTVQVGSIVEEEFVRETHTPFFEGGAFGSASFHSSVPIARMSLVIDIPKGVPLKWKKARLEPVMTDTEEAGRRKLTFVVENIEPLKFKEWNVYAELDRYPNVSFSTGTSWAPIAQAYGKLVADKIGGEDHSQLAKEMIGSETTRKGKIDKILAGVRKRVRYTGIEFGRAAIDPRKPSETLKRTFGDCKDQATLLVALLKAVGIEAQVALLHPGLDLDLDPELPSLSRFSHAIVRVPGTPDVWIDSTGPFARAGTLPMRDKGRWALIAGENVTELIKTPAAVTTDNEYVETRQVYFQSTGKARVVETSRSGGSIEMDERASQASTEEALLKNLKRYSKTLYKSDKVSNVKATAVDDLSKPYELSFSVEDSEIGQTVGGEAWSDADENAVFKWVPDALLERPKAEPEVRTQDFRAIPHAIELRFEYVPPPGFVPMPLVNVPAIDLGAAARLDRKLTEGPKDTINYTVRFSLLKGRLSPADVMAFRKGMDAWGEAPRIRALFVHRGARLYSRGQFKEGLDVYRSAAKANPKSGLARASYAAALLAVGFGDRARQVAKEAVELAPKSAEVLGTAGTILSHGDAGRLYGRGFERAAAIDAMKRAVAANPDADNSAYDLAVMHEIGEDGGRYKSSPEDMDAAIELYDSLGTEKIEALGVKNAANNVLVALLRRGRFSDLVKRLEGKAISTEHYGLLVSALTHVRGADAAVEVLERSGLDAATQQTTLLGAAANLRNIRDYPGATKLYERAGRNAANAVAFGQLVQVFSKLKRLEDGTPPKRGPERAAFAVLQAIFRGDEPKAFRPLLTKEFATKDEGDISFYRTFLSSIASDHVGTLEGVQRRDVSSLVDFRTTGSDEFGYRVELRLSFPTPRRLDTWYVVKTRRGYRVIAFFDRLNFIAARAFRLLGKKRFDSAQKWLEWARTDTAAAETSRFAAFRRILGADKPDLELASAMLGATAKPGRLLKRATSVLENRLASTKDESLRNDIESTLLLALERGKQYKKAVALADKRLAARGHDIDVARQMYRALVNDGRWKVAEKRLEEAIRRDPAAKPGLSTLAHLYSGEGEFSLAISTLERMIELGRATPNTYNQIAWFGLFLDGAPDQFLNYGTHAVRQTKAENPSYLHTLATLYAELGKVPEARQMLLARLRWRGELDSDDWYIVGRLAEHFELKEEARKAYGRVERPEKKEPAATYHLAQRRLHVLKGR